MPFVRQEVLFLIHAQISQNDGQPSLMVAELSFTERKTKAS
jgi:hypothetical protein